jgi:hypothetical protein
MRPQNVPYQIRCSVSYGEKVLGELNDDRILRTATRVLRTLLCAVLQQHNEQWLESFAVIAQADAS